MRLLSWPAAKMAAVICAAAVVLGPAAQQRVLAQASRPARGPAASPTPAPAAGGRVWTCDVVSDEQTASAAGTLHPMTIVAARNGSFSGKVVVESPNPVKGIKATVSAISGEGGAIPAQNVQLRYAVGWDERGWALPSNPDILLETPPAQVETTAISGRGRVYAPVWLTVKVPKDAKPGTYSGEVTVQAQGIGPAKVPVKVEVQNWTVPDPQDYRTWMDFIESPDTLALEYKTPLWSDKHWDLIGKSFRLLSDSGSRVLYVPLICRTNFGNEQSMVRWIPKGDGKYDYDYSVLDKYLDSAQKNLGNPKLTIFLVWDICQSKDALTRGLWGKDQGGGATIEARQGLLGKGPRVTALDPATKEANFIFLPRYEDPSSKSLWQPVWTEVRKKMAARGLEKTMMLGIMPDLWPNKEEVTFWKDVTGGLSWAIHGHAGAPGDAGPGNKLLYKIADIGYAAYVYNLVFNVNPDKGRMYGWNSKALISNYLRGGELNAASAIEIREFPAFNITGGQRGGGRMGADFWRTIRDKKGQRTAAVYARYPENNWRNLDISDWFLAPGPDGALATVRLECLKEGEQECEARICMESALLDAGQKAKLGEELATRCQTFLDEHHRAMWKTAWADEEDLASLGKVGDGRNPQEGLWYALVKAGKKLPEFWSGPARTLRSDEASKGEQWFVVGWQEREKKLFSLAGEVTAKLGGK
jgi:hypothetical protein